MQTHELRNKEGNKEERKYTTTDKRRDKEEVESFNVKKSRVLPIDRHGLSNLFNSRIKR